MTNGDALSLPLKDMYPLIAEALDSGREVYLTIRGNSMAPFLADSRDQAVFAPLRNRRVRRGDIVFYQRDSGQFVMHRVYRASKDGALTLLGDAQWTLERGVRRDQLRAYVVRVVRKGRELSCERGLWRRLMTAYMLRVRFPRLAKLGLRALHAPRAALRKLRGNP